MIVNYELREKLPKAIADFVFDDRRITETPKYFGNSVINFVIGTLGDSCEAAIKAAKGMGEDVLILSSYMEGGKPGGGHFSLLRLP